MGYKLHLRWNISKVLQNNVIYRKGFVKENGQNVTKYRNMQAVEAVEAVEASLKGLGLSNTMFDILAESRLLNF